MQSFASRLMPFVIRLRGSKKRYSSAELTLAKVHAQQLRPKPFAPPRGLEKKVDLAVRFVDGWPVYELSPKGRLPERRALYLHGGSYVYEISSQHWGIVAELAQKTDSRILIPIYPLAPRGTAGPIVAGCVALATALIDEVGVERVTVLGDSAGGGMALATALELESKPRVILISPILDLALDDPAVAALVPRDPWLDLPGAKASGELYRGELPFDDPRVSPMLGDFSTIGPVAVFTGTRDMLNADARRFETLAATSGHPIELHDVPEMIHVFPLLPIPEAATARAQMVEFILR